MEKNFRHDFFDDKISERKSRKPAFLSKYSKHRLLPHLKIPMEHVIIIAIGILILLSIVYAIGVERGKRSQVASLVEPHLSVR